MPQNDDAYHLLRCLVKMALADQVVHDAETEVLEQVARSIGQLDAATWERAWEEVVGGATEDEILEAVPPRDRLRRFILRELATMALADGEIDDRESLMLTAAANHFDLAEELDRFVDWAVRAQGIFDEGERLLEP